VSAGEEGLLLQYSIFLSVCEDLIHKVLSLKNENLRDKVQENVNCFL